MLAEAGCCSIYKVTVNGEEKAFRWYTSSPLDDGKNSFWLRTRDKVKRGSPCDSFPWPEDLTENSEKGFGYIQKLIPKEYKYFPDILRREVGFSSFQAITNVALNMVDAFRHLHCAGYCYYTHNCNFLVNTSTGDLLLTDVDYIVYEGERFNIISQPRYMSPEVVLGKSAPGAKNDQFVMSIFLFMLFCLNHPFEGKRYLAPALSPELQKKLYGSEALFMMDPDDKSNAPHPVIHKNSILLWNCLPEYMQQFFIRAFSQEALQYPSARPTEAEWLQVLCKMNAGILRCSCGSEIFVESKDVPICDNCGNSIPVRLWLEVNEFLIPAVRGKRLFCCYCKISDPNESLVPVAQVVTKKDDPDILGLRNISPHERTAISELESSRRVAPGAVVLLQAGMTLDILGSAVRVTVTTHLPE